MVRLPTARDRAVRLGLRLMPGREVVGRGAEGVTLGGVWAETEEGVIDPLPAGRGAPLEAGVAYVSVDAVVAGTLRAAVVDRAVSPGGRAVMEVVG